VVAIYENVSREKAKIESSLSEYLSSARKSNEQLSSNSTKISQQTREIEENEEALEKLTGEISSLTSQRDEIQKRIESGISNEKERNERVKAIELDIRTLNGNRESLVDQIAKAHSDLKELKDEINLFPTEIAGYIGQGSKNIRTYFWLSFIPALLIGVVTYRLFANAERLLDFQITEYFSDIIKFMLSRSPYVVVSAAVLGICYSVLKALVTEIVNINRRRQELFKVSIIARDVSYASQHGLDLDLEQAYNLKTQTKMELLKEHLKMNLGDDFSYLPQKLFWDRLKSVRPRQVDDSSADPKEPTQPSSVALKTS